MTPLVFLLVTVVVVVLFLAWVLWRKHITGCAEIRSGRALAEEMVQLIKKKGRTRFSVWGNCGAGKSTLTSQLATELCVPELHLDYLQFKGDNWETHSRSEVKASLKKWLDMHREKGWIADGNCRRATLLSQCDGIILLDLPFRATFWRLLKRTLRRVVTKERLFGNNVETWGNVYRLWDTRNCILAYSLAQRNRHREVIPKMLEQFPHLSLFRFSSPRQVGAFLCELQQQMGHKEVN